MNKINLNEIRKIQLDMLIDIDNVCRKYKIEYFLDGGTCLGAVRHKGFIPWDDDLDIIMKRDHYDKFNVIYSEEGKYKIFNHHNNDSYYYGFSKIVDMNTTIIRPNQRPIDDLGVNVDVFPCDGVPENELIRIIFLRGIQILKKTIAPATVQKERYMQYPLYKKIIFNAVKFIGHKYWLNIIESILRISSKKNKSLLFDVIGAFKPYAYVSSECFSKQIYIKFEDVYAPIPIGYDEYLRTLYGDYMELPPIEERCGKHSFEAFYK